ncbi:acid phosphatase type 7 [Aplysia californica]|uniref:Purple acid phosphatase n=1 Tax=Aplysia californica TaxID=6500 RepID=A0ABM0K1R0_APLCA|nr:acid phosphatase type 7 [Aplysia californica]XP_012942580.1 acid phosphatase type 7 [Aplysia californica]
MMASSLLTSRRGVQTLLPSRPCLGLYFILICIDAVFASEELGSFDYPESMSTMPAPVAQNALTRDSFKPQHVHISFGDSIQEINIVWATQQVCKPKVQYGSHPWGLELTVVGKSIQFVEYNEQGLQNVHRVRLKDLLALTTYFYRVFCNDHQVGPFYFQTPQAGNEWSPDFLLFGDLGIHSQSIPSLVAAAMSGNYTAVFHAGDIAYDMKHWDGLVGDYFMKLIEPLASTIPYLTCPGNHEIDFDSFVHYRYRFSMPNTDWPIPQDKMWYSIDIGPVHLISYSSEVFFTNYGNFEKAQRDWLVKDLKAANANRLMTPWIVAIGHRPMYCSTHIGDDCAKVDSLVRQGFEEIFRNSKVDLVIQAHEHNYERLWPMYQGNVTQHSYANPDVPVQIITGAGGSREGADVFDESERPDWSAFRLDNSSLNSYGRLLVVNSTHVLWEQRSALDHTTLDSIWVRKDRNFSSPQNQMKEIDSQSDLASRDSVFASRLLTIGLSVAGLLAVVVFVLVVRVLVKRRRKRANARLWERNTVNFPHMKTLVLNYDSDDEFQ